MAQTRIQRSRTTLLDQISVTEPTNLRDFLNIRQDDSIHAAGRRGGGVVTLASILESEKRGERRLLDILREEGESSGTPPVVTEGRAIRIPLMTLMGLTEEAGGDDATTAAVAVGPAGGEAVAEEAVCCVCLVRKKGAAFIPCGHTYCRLCSRELWTSRGSCPLCNGAVVDVLDIF